MRKMNVQSSRWVQRQAAKHTTPDSIRRRITQEEAQIRDLWSIGLTGPGDKAQETHRELIRVLTERLADLFSR